ncbi:MAG: TIGR03617 family F420-dependent LLM class oxidoreductase [Ilumatobacteraceae bacterium]
MHVDVMTGPGSWNGVQRLARDVEGAGFSGMVLTEGNYTPWLSVAAAHMAAPRLHLATGVAVAFPRSPMVTAQTAWELAELTGGQFRLGLGSQVKAHVERRYGSEFSPPVARMRDYVLAVKATWAAFRGDAPLAHDGRFYHLNLMTTIGQPRRHAHEHIKVDIAAVGDAMVTAAGEVADGIHVHPFHSMHYLRGQMIPTLAAATARAGRSLSDVDLIVPVLVAPGDTPEERAPAVERCRAQLAFYGSTKNYAFQFDDLGFAGTSAALNERLKAGDQAGMSALISDEVLAHFAVVCPWDDVADELLGRYGDLAHRLVMYTAVDGIRRDPSSLGRWGEIARTIAAA